MDCEYLPYRLPTDPSERLNEQCDAKLLAASFTSDLSLILVAIDDT